MVMIMVVVVAVVAVAVAAVTIGGSVDYHDSNNDNVPPKTNLKAYPSA